MTPGDRHSEKSSADAAEPAARGEKVFSAIDYAIKVVVVSLVVLGGMMVALRSQA